MSEAVVGRPRDHQLHAAILESTRELLSSNSYAELSMESVATHAQVGKKTLYRRWPSKAPLVAEAVLDAYGRSGSFDLHYTADVRADLRRWLIEHAEFIADPRNAGLIRALIAASAANPLDNDALYQQLSKPQHAGLTNRLAQAVEDGHLRPGTDVDAIANALVGTLLLQVLNSAPPQPKPPGAFNGILDAIFNGIASEPGGSPHVE